MLCVQNQPIWRLLIKGWRRGHTADPNERMSVLCQLLPVCLFSVPPSLHLVLLRTDKEIGIGSPRKETLPHTHTQPGWKGHCGERATNPGSSSAHTMSSCWTKCSLSRNLSALTHTAHRPGSRKGGLPSFTNVWLCDWAISKTSGSANQWIIQGSLRVKTGRKYSCSALKQQAEYTLWGTRRASTAKQKNICEECSQMHRIKISF